MLVVLSRALLEYQLEHPLKGSLRRVCPRSHRCSSEALRARSSDSEIKESMNNQGKKKKGVALNI